MYKDQDLDNTMGRHFAHMWKDQKFHFKSI
jgi:hypothetical protein